MSMPLAVYKYTNITTELPGLDVIISLTFCEFAVCKILYIVLPGGFQIINRVEYFVSCLLLPIVCLSPLSIFS